MHTIIAVLLLGILWLPMVSSNRATPVWVEVDSEPACHLEWDDRWVEICHYHCYTASTLFVRNVRICEGNDCSELDPLRMEGDTVRWSGYTFTSPETVQVRATMASGDEQWYPLREVCVGNCDWWK